MITLRQFLNWSRPDDVPPYPTYDLFEWVGGSFLGFLISLGVLVFPLHFVGAIFRVDTGWWWIGLSVVMTVVWICAIELDERKNWAKDWKRDHCRVTTGTAVPKEGMVAQIGWTSVLRLNTGDIAVGVRLTANQAWPPKKRTNGQLPVSGPPVFVEATRRLLRELAERAPHRYQEAMELMPQAIFDLSVEGHFGARSDGIFKIDGSDYGQFRWTFAHELGHNVGCYLSWDTSEEFANDYANRVMSELGG